MILGDLNNDQIQDLKYSYRYFNKKDMLVIFYPYEIHRPGISNIEKRSVRKAIFKILVKDYVW